MITAFALGKVAVDDLHAQPVKLVDPHDESTLLVHSAPRQTELDRARWRTRQERHAVVALLTVVVDVRVTERLQRLEWKLIVRYLGFLQRDDVWTVLFGDGFELVEAGANAVGVERNKAHSGPLLKRLLCLKRVRKVTFSNYLKKTI